MNRLFESSDSKSRIDETLKVKPAKAFLPESEKGPGSNIQLSNDSNTTPIKHLNPSLQGQLPNNKQHK